MIWLDLAPRPSPSPTHLKSASCLSVSVFLFVAGPEEEVGEEPNHMTAKKPGPLQIINILWLYFSCSEDWLQPGAASSIKLIKLLAKSSYEPVLEYCLIFTGLILETLRK
jgi:hypothetical protein